MKISAKYLGKKLFTQYAKILGSDLLTPEWFNSMLDIKIDNAGVSFENVTAENFFKRAVVKAVDSSAYNLVFPVMQMDENGNYTTNPEAWV